MGFNHSVKVPTQYRKSAIVLKQALEHKKSIKSLIFEATHARKRGLQAVIKHYCDNRRAIDDAIEKTQILVENPRLCPALCKILVTELIFGRKQLIGESKPVITVRSYKDSLAAALLGTESSATTNKVVKPRYVRVNKHLLSIAEVLEGMAAKPWRRKEPSQFESYEDFLAAVKALEEDEYLVDMHLDDVLIFHAKQKHYWACHELVQEKKLMLQDKATCLVAELLHPPPGAVVLDMCAAPGMKTIQLSNIMDNQGTIYAVERDLERYRLLCKMTESAGCKIVEAINADALTIDSERCPGVEYILVDPSCSGSGMQSRISLEADEKDKKRLEKLAGFQIKLLTHAMSSFPDVKRIAYSTCSIYEEENEQVVQRVLLSNPQFKLLSCKKALRNKWIRVGNTQYTKVGKNCLYAKPNEDLTDGIFIAIFEKRRNADEAE